MPARLLIVDNYDSFTYNLVQELSELGADVEVVRNDAFTVDEVLADPLTGSSSLRAPEPLMTRDCRTRRSRRWPACVRCSVSASAISASGSSTAAMSCARPC